MSNANGATFLAIDVGTGTLKAAAAGSGGRLLSVATAPAPYRAASVDGSLSRDFDVDALWPAIVGVARRALHDAGVSNGSVAAIGVTSQRQGIGALDTEGRELFLGPNMDLRALFDGIAFDEANAGTVYSLTGHLPSFLLAPLKLRWRQQNDPAVYERIASVLTVGDWVGYRLTGEVALQETLASEAGLLDVASGARAGELFETLGVRTDFIPPVTGRLVQLGGLSEDAAAQLGLSPGTPVVVAGPDTQCGLLAMGVTSPGTTGVVAGWSVTAQRVTATPVPDAARHTWVGRHVLPERWVAESNAGDGGNAYRWLLELLVGTEDGGFERMESLMSEAPPGADGAVALIGPAPLDLSRPRLQPGGLLFPVPVTFSGLDRARLARAALENVVFAVRGASELLDEVTGAPP
ncbi:MAG: FGGY-family carbohydrate kinase, partial [Chloroflexota bacterium]|nr:FGGY-family carbohydrate kinase [Chloroflexota bacterium]